MAVAPRPFVSSRMASTTSTSAGLITWSAPSSMANARRSGTTSTAITFAPIALADNVPLAPTGPWPNTTTMSRPETSIFLSPFQAVPVPQEMAAPSSKDNSSSRSTRLREGTKM